MKPETAGLTANEQWLRYANQAATRNQPLSPEMLRAMSFLGDMGVEMEVFSGGQPGIETGSDRRVGSTRHDHGGAADVFFNQNGRRLDWANEADRPIFEEIVRRSRQNGITGIGAGEGYMRPGSMHIGFGNEAVWGAGGRGENAPEWLRNAFHSVGGGGHGHASRAEAQAAKGGSQGGVSNDAFMRAFNRVRGDQQPAKGEARQKLTAQDRMAGVGAALMSLDQGGSQEQSLAQILQQARRMPAFNRKKGLSL